MKASYDLLCAWVICMGYAVAVCIGHVQQLSAGVICRPSSAFGLDMGISRGIFYSR